MSRFAELIGDSTFGGELVRRNSLADLRPPPRQGVRHFPEQIETDVVSTALRILRKRKLTIISFSVLVLLLVTAGSFLITPKYEAVAKIVFNHENINPLGFKDLTGDYGQNSEDAVSLDTQVQILQSASVAAQVIRQLHLDHDSRFAGKGRPSSAANADASTYEAEDLLNKFSRGLSVSKQKNTRVIEIRYKSTAAKLSADIANAITTAYIEHNFKMRFDSTMQTSKWLAQQLTELATKVQESQTKLVDYQKEHGYLQLDDKQNLVTTRLDDLNRELTAAQSDRINKEASYRFTLARSAELTEKAERDALLDKLHAQEADIQNQLAQATVQLGPSNPKVQELSNQLKETQREIGSEQQKMSDRVQTQYLQAAARERMIRNAVDEQKNQANRLNEVAIEYGLLKRDAESDRQLYEGLLQKLKEAGVSAGLRSSNIQVVDVAQIPPRPSEPNIPLNIAMAVFLGLSGGIGLAFVQEKFDRTVRSFQTFGAASSLTQLGVIPLISSTDSRLASGNASGIRSLASATTPAQPAVNSDPQSPAAESYRALVNSILLSVPVPPKVILLTSPVTGDGKTLTSINLATVLAKQRSRVLLVDADLCRPSMSKVLGLPTAEGLSTIIRERDARLSPQDSAHFEPSPVPVPGIANLFLMQAGPTDSDSAELVGSRSMQNLLQEWRKQFDYIIIDSSPVAVVSNVVRLCVSVDSVILLVRWGHTPQEAFRRAQQLLTQVNAPLAGIVFNGVDGSQVLPYYTPYSYYDSGQARVSAEGPAEVMRTLP